MSNQDITHCVSVHNTLNYLKLAVKSVRKYSHYQWAPFIVYAENCTDGTNEWLKEVQEEYGLDVYIEENNKTIRGIGGGMNYCAERVKTEFINFIHADFFVSKNWDFHLKNIFDKYPNEKIVACSQRIQPSVFDEDDRPGTHFVPLDEFGEYHDNFDEDYFIRYAEEFSALNELEIPKGEGVSYMIRKSDWDEVGGNDDRYSPAYFEDYDLFMRMRQQGFRFVLTTKSVVYHFGSRTSRFPDDNLKSRPQHLADAERNSYIKFVEKWGHPPRFDEYGMITL